MAAILRSRRNDDRRRRLGPGDQRLDQRAAGAPGRKARSRVYGRANACRALAARAWASQPSRWSFTSPIACMNAKAVVGPTNLQPAASGLFDRATLDAARSTRSAAARLPASGSNRQTRGSDPSLGSSAPRRGVVDHRLDLAPVAHDPGVREQALDVPLAEPGDAVEPKPSNAPAELFPLSQDRPPSEFRPGSPPGSASQTGARRWRREIPTRCRDRRGTPAPSPPTSSAPRRPPRRRSRRARGRRSPVLSSRSPVVIVAPALT